MVPWERLTQLLTKQIKIHVGYIIDRQMIKQALLLLVAAVLVASLPAEDLVSSPPGMIGTTIYSGYLNAAKPGRQIHYIFVQANVTDPSAAPLTLWLNGGPGCSSLIGMLQEIGPYIVGNSYKQGDLLTKNEYGWHKVSNLLFLESPATVGFSSDKDKQYAWTDEETAMDAFTALKDFLFNKADEFSNRTLFISGESYAGKYVPDITNLILNNNADTTLKYINIQGIMVGNGVMSFEDNSLDKSQIDYMVDHQSISNRMELIYRKSCYADFDSPRCQFFRYEFDIYNAYINQYNIYETCKDSSSQANRLKEALSARKSLRKNGFITQKQGYSLGEIPDCPSDDGAIQYWNLNKIPFKVDKVGKNWQVCTDINYAISDRGSMEEYRRIFLNKGVRVWLFSGDWDDVVPFTDTEKNVDALRRTKVGEWTAWNVGDQHAGFFQIYENNFTTITVKRAGHMVPQTQPKSAFQLFYNFVNNKGVNNQVF